MLAHFIKEAAEAPRGGLQRGLLPLPPLSCSQPALGGQQGSAIDQGAVTSPGGQPWRQESFLGVSRCIAHVRLHWMPHPAGNVLFSRVCTTPWAQAHTAGCPEPRPCTCSRVEPGSLCPSVAGRGSHGGVWDLPAWIIGGIQRSPDFPPVLPPSSPCWSLLTSVPGLSCHLTPLGCLGVIHASALGLLPCTFIWIKCNRLMGCHL